MCARNGPSPINVNIDGIQLPLTPPRSGSSRSAVFWHETIGRWTNRSAVRSDPKRQFRESTRLTKRFDSLADHV